jgi:hypothetical protein
MLGIVVNDIAALSSEPQFFWLLPPEPVERLIAHPQTLFCRLVLRSEQPDRHRAVITGLTDAKVPPRSQHGKVRYRSDADRPGPKAGEILSH